jgi:glycosyltransferase involved in cell wall biosynthesis
MRSGNFRALPRIVARSVDTARGVTRLLPPSTRGRVRSFADWSDRLRPAPPITDWSRPLIAARPSAGVYSNLLTGATDAGGGPGVVEPTRQDAPDGPTEASPDGIRCLVVTALLDVGGMDEVVAFLARRLPRHGFQTAVLHATTDPSATGAPTGRLGQMLQAAGIEVYEADAKGALDWVRRWRPDVITAHGAPDWMITVAEEVGVPYVTNLHGMHHHFGVDWGAEAARARRFSAIVSVSGLITEQYLAGNPGFPRDRIVTIPNGVDEERRGAGERDAVRERLGLTDEYVFVSLARHCQQKNSFGLIAAFAELAGRHPDAHLVIAGRPDQSRYYRHLLRLRDQFPCADRIHLRDHATAPAELLAAADGFALDSFFEGWSLASTEALFSGLPVVLSEVGGAREQIGGDPDRGYLVANPLGDPLAVNWESLAANRYRSQVNRDELVTAMGHLISRREDYLNNRKKLMTESAARFSAGVCLARHAAVLRAVATNTGLPGCAAGESALVEKHEVRS